MQRDPSQALLLWDHEGNIPLARVTAADDLILLLTPAAIHPESSRSTSSDPFEALGRTISAHHSAVRHVPYTKRGGITGTHAAFIKRCRIVVFVISGPQEPDEVSQSDLALAAASLAEDSVFVVVACCDVLDYDLRARKFPTVVQTDGYRPAELQSAGRLLFSEKQGEAAADALAVPTSPQRWPVEKWRREEDLLKVQELWTHCFSNRFHLPPSVLSSLLTNEGDGNHFVIRDSDSRHLVGFCATFTTSSAGHEQALIGSVAVLLVRKPYRGRGIGTSLHDAAVQHLRNTPGIEWLQLGSTFPRLLYGVPVNAAFEKWFFRRGWNKAEMLTRHAPEASDWVISLSNTVERNLSTSGLSFQPCTSSCKERVLRFVEGVSRRQGFVGWRLQYGRVASSRHLGDIIVGFEGQTVVSAAILYAPTPGHPIAEVMPWTRTIGSGVGGLACICITDNDPEMVNSRDSIMVRLLDYCIKSSAARGLDYLFLDAVRGGDSRLQALGFQRWARYSEIWKKI